MARTLDLGNISTRLRRIAKLAGEAPHRVLVSIAHQIDEYFLRDAYARTRKDGAPGVDGQTAREYEKDLGGNLRSLHDRLKSGRYQAPPVRRAYIPKGNGETRPIGIPTLEDKVLQRAVTRVLEAVYEQDFLPCSYGFRPGRSAHQALEALRSGIMSMNGGWVYEVDIRSFYDTLDHGHLRSFLDQRVRDGVLRRAIGKWLKAGVLEGGSVHYPERGTPQGGVISPLLGNIYLHEVVDKWFENEVRPRLRDRAFLVRYADDLVIVCRAEHDARRIADVLPKRLGRFGLSIHPDKTRLVRFERPARSSRPKGGDRPESFEFLGFTHHWGLSRRGNWVVLRKTAPKRLSRALREIRQWCHRHRHQPLRWQQEKLTAKLRGHYSYYGITGNFRAIGSFYWFTCRAWRRGLKRRSQRGLNWEKFNQKILRLFPLPFPRIVHPWCSEAVS
jgi:group II intron reverse transcriptase/maturase